MGEESNNGRLSLQAYFLVPHVVCTSRHNSMPRLSSTGLIAFILNEWFRLFQLLMREEGKGKHCPKMGEPTLEWAWAHHYLDRRPYPNTSMKTLQGDVGDVRCHCSIRIRALLGLWRAHSSYSKEWIKSAQIIFYFNTSFHFVEWAII